MSFILNKIGCANKNCAAYFDINEVAKLSYGDDFDFY